MAEEVTRIQEFIQGLAAETGELASLCDELADALRGMGDNGGARSCWTPDANEALGRYAQSAARIGAKCENCGKGRLDIVYEGEVWLCAPCARGLGVAGARQERKDPIGVKPEGYRV